MYFLILRPLSPKTGYHFFGGGWGGGGGGQKFSLNSSGEAYGYHITAGRMVKQPTHGLESAVRTLACSLLQRRRRCNYLPRQGSNR